MDETPSSPWKEGQRDERRGKDIEETKKLKQKEDRKEKRREALIKKAEHKSKADVRHLMSGYP